MISESLPSDLNVRIAEQVRLLRRQRGLSLEELAARSGVSRSMISVIERGESSATAVVLERLATALGVALASLFDRPDAPASPLSRRDEQPTWRDPQSGYQRRNVSPPGFTAPLRIVEVLFPPQARVAYETAEREVPVHQQVWVLEGRLLVGTGEQQHDLGPGDCLAMTLDAPTFFHNPGPQTTRYAVVLNVAPENRR